MRTTIAIVLTGVLSLQTGCGRKKDSGGDAGAPAGSGEATPAGAETGTETATAGPIVEEAEDAPVETSELTAQLGDETVGVKNGEQLTSHFSLMTSIPFTDLDQGQREAVNRLKLALPIDNSAGKFNSSHALAAVKLATIYCQEFVDREQTARTDPDSGLTPLLPDLDWGSDKLAKELARPIYQYFVDIFWGLDRSVQPSRDAYEGALDELVDAINEPVVDESGNPVSPGLTNVVLGICVATAASFPSAEF
jgi:hypothetical protein